MAISNTAQRRFFFLLVWRRVLRTPAVPIFFILILHPRDDNAERARTHETIFYRLHPPPSNTGADGTHGSSRRTTRTAPQEDLNAPRRSVQRSFRTLTTRVGLFPRPRAFERIQRLWSPVNPPSFLHNHVEGRFFFYFQIYTCLHSRNVYCELWVRSFCLWVRSIARSVLDAAVRLTAGGSSGHPESKWALWWLSGWDFCLWDRGIIRTSGYVLMAASPIGHLHPFEWNWSDLRQIGNSS